MDKKRLDKERAKLLKEIRGYTKAIKFNGKLAVDKHDDYPCVMIDGIVHIAKQESEEKPGLYGYYVYYAIGDTGSYWEPPSYDYVPVPYGEDTSTEEGYGWFTHLSDAVEAAMKFYVSEEIGRYSEYLMEKEIEESEAKYIASLSEEERREMGY